MTDMDSRLIDYSDEYRDVAEKGGGPDEIFEGPVEETPGSRGESINRREETVRTGV